MNRYPLIGVSILAVVLLILCSLTNVVGYQSIQSSGANDSPLFSVRTKRAINQENKGTITSDYLGKGTRTLLQFSPRDDRIDSLKKAIKYISKMDDKTFAQFTELCIQKAKQDKTISDTNPNEILQALHQFRTKPETIINSFISGNNPITPSRVATYANNWFCNLIFILFLISLWLQTLLRVIVSIALGGNTCYVPPCGP
jgi:hypothetical protein